MTEQLTLPFDDTYMIDGVTYDVNSKPSNPKDIIGSNKVPLGLVPGVTMAYLAVGHLEGDLKYGRVNWREAGVRTMIYLDACLRHIEKFKEGEWSDPKTKVPHLANALACLSIIADAHHAGKLIDDRPKSTPAAEVIDQMSEAVLTLKSLYGDNKPVDYFIDGPKQRE
jgi:dATP/dGTP diphosphohydrolase